MPYFPPCHRNADVRSTKKFVDAIAPRRQPVFTAIKRERTTYSYSYSYEEQAGKISLYVAYAVTRDEHRGRDRSGGKRLGGRQRENDLVACRANWPWSFLIRSIYRTRRVFRPLSFSFSRSYVRPLLLSFPFFRSAECSTAQNEMPRIYQSLPFTESILHVDSQLYNPRTTD